MHSYLLRLWIGTLLLGTFVMTVYDGLHRWRLDLDMIYLYPIIVLIGGLLSLPTFLLCLLTLMLAESSELNVRQLKALLLLEVVCFIGVTILPLYGARKGIPIVVGYSAATAALSGLLKVKTSPERSSF